MNRSSIALALVIISTLALLYLWITYNHFIRMRNRVKTDYADVDVQLKRRASLIEQLAALVKDYAKHEKSTFEDVAKARSALDTSKNAKEAAKAENMFTDTLRSLFMVVESYPQLQASENYKLLRDDLNETENLIAQYRETYNQTVQKYNDTVQTFPNLMVARLFGFHEAQLFQTTENAPKV